MGLFGKIFGGNNKNVSESKSPKSEAPDFSYIADLARLISSNDTRLTAKIDRMLTSPEEYFSENAERYEERGLDVKTADRDTLMWIGFVDELSEHGYLFGVDWKCEAEDFKWALSQLKSGDVIPDLELDENGDPEEWGNIINNALTDYCVCRVDIDSDSYEMIIVTAEAFEDISRIAEQNKHRIVKF